MEPITVETTVNVPRAKAWELFTKPEHITGWNAASPDWQCPRATNDLRPGGSFSYRMEAKDGGVGFDFAGTYTEVVPNERFAFEFGGRTAVVTFADEGSGTRIVETFDPETENPVEMQRQGWQAILENFKRYAEKK